MIGNSKCKCQMIFLCWQESFLQQSNSTQLLNSVVNNFREYNLNPFLEQSFCTFSKQCRIIPFPLIVLTSFQPLCDNEIICGKLTMIPIFSKISNFNIVDSWNHDKLNCPLSPVTVLSPRKSFQQVRQMTPMSSNQHYNGSSSPGHPSL